MNKSNIEKIESLNLDDFIWYIYIFIAVAALYPNYIGKEYYRTGNKKNFTEFHNINLVVLTIAFLVYVYFIFTNFKNYHKKKSINGMLGIISSILFLVGGGILLLVELYNARGDDEIAL